jgi:hypothetical protein
MKRTLLLTLGALAAAAFLAPRAEADVILTFGQSGQGNTTFAVASGNTSTTITDTNTAISITQILNSVPVVNPTIGFFNLTATSVANSVTTTALGIAQEFSGVFSLTSGLNGTGINYLSGTFLDLTFGLNGGTSATMSSSQPPSVVSFTSDVITALDLPRALSLSFANATPSFGGTGICPSPATGLTNCTIGTFASSTSGTFSAAAAPEPASLALLGVGLLGLGFVANRKRSV